MNTQVHPEKDQIAVKSDINVEMTNLLNSPETSKTSNKDDK